jgi:hypothetical protein
MAHHPGPNLHKPPDDQVCRWLDALPPERRIMDHVEQIVSRVALEFAAFFVLLLYVTNPGNMV